MLRVEKLINLNSGPNDDAHEEVGNDASDGHHEAFNNGHT